MSEQTRPLLDIFTAMFDLVPFGIYIVDVKNYDLLYVNRHFKERLGTDGQRYCWQLLHQLDRPCANCKIPLLIDNDGQPNEKIEVYEQFNEVDDCWYQIQEQCLELPDGRTAIYSIAMDISSLKQIQNSLAEAHAQLALKNRALQTLSTTDQLTGLYNRMKLDEVLMTEITRAQRYGTAFSLIMLDLDHFKVVNDIHGHQVGDRVLIRLAEMLRASSRESDVVGRWGGEEFLIICPQTDREGARTSAEHLCKTIATTVLPVVGYKTASFGIAAYRTGDDEEKILQRADEALYRAKEAGRNRVVVESPVKSPENVGSKQ